MRQGGRSPRDWKENEGEGTWQEKVQAEGGEPKWMGVAQRHKVEGTSPSLPHYQSIKEDRLGKEIEVTSQSSDNKHRNMLLMCVTSSYA